MTTEPINPLDLAFLLLESETAPLHIGAVAVFRPRREVDAEHVADLLRERTARIPLLHRRARFTSWSPNQACWEHCENVNTADHVHTHHLPSPGGPAEFAELVSRIGAESLDLTRPLWELHLVTGLDDERFAVLVKLHHALADGATAVKLSLGFLDPAATTLRTSSTETEPPDTSPLWQTLAEPRQMFDNILTSAQNTLNTAGETMSIASHVLSSARIPSPSPLATANSPSRRMAMVRLPVTELRRIRAHHGGTTNEVVLTVISGALRHWMASRGHSLDNLDLRALIPVSRRARSRQAQAGNQLSGYLCTLPISDPEPLSRLSAIRATMAENKSAGPLRGAGAFPVLADRAPPVLHRIVTPVAGHFASLLFDTMITQAPIPNLPLSLAGAELHELYPLAPLPSGHTLSVGTAQYRDTVHIGLNCDRTAVPDIEKLTEALPQALDELHTSGQYH